MPTFSYDSIKKILVIIFLIVSGFFVFRHIGPFAVFRTASVLSPLGGTFTYGQTVDVRWTSGSPGIRLIELVPVSGGSSVTVYNAQPFGYPIGDTSGSYPFLLSQVTPPGSYYVRIYKANSYEYDQSSGVITIQGTVSPTLTPPPASSGAGTPSPYQYQGLLTSHHQVKNITVNSADMTIESSIPAVMSIEYNFGSASHTGTFNTPWPTTYTTSHVVALTNLRSGTQYFYYVHMKSISGLDMNAGPLAFTTLPSGQPTILPPTPRYSPRPAMRVPSVTIPAPVKQEPVITPPATPSPGGTPIMNVNVPTGGKNSQLETVPVAHGFLDRMWGGIKGIFGY